MAGLLLGLILTAPMSHVEIQRVYCESMIKEMTVMESVKRACTLNFSVFFGSYNEQLHHEFPCNPTMSKRIHGYIDTWIRSLEDRLLYPQVSSKTVSHVTASNLKSAYPEYEPFDKEVGITGIDLERIRHQYGQEIEGPCEMRQKWYCSNLKPRTYYAQGGTAHHSSKYLALPFVDLCDLLPCTNRRTRVDPSRILIDDPSADVIYYDLVSFTSNLHVQSHFLFRLSEYCRGKKILILDARDGIVEQDLGGLIYRYTRTNLIDPEYTLPAKYNNPDEVHYHSVAGFLGVYGNISTATFIHGAVMSMLHVHLNENNVAGDDGLDVTTDVSGSLKLVSTMGEVSDEKTFRGSEGCCIHLKRPITRIGKRLYHGNLLNWPSLEQGQTEVDPRYPYLGKLSQRERQSKVASSVTTFLRNLETLQISRDEEELIDKHICYMYKEFRLPREGCVPQVTPSSLGFVPAYERRYLGLEPITNTIGRLYTGIARVPLREKIPMEEYMLGEASFRCNQSKLLRYLEILGYVEQEKLDICMFGKAGYERLVSEYLYSEPRVYNYIPKKELPVWAYEIVCS
jgi:hypothetical protein